MRRIVETDARAIQAAQALREMPPHAAASRDVEQLVEAGD